VFGVGPEVRIGLLDWLFAQEVRPELDGQPKRLFSFEEFISLCRLICHFDDRRNPFVFWLKKISPIVEMIVAVPCSE
jgi:hypothetical protein